MQRRPGDLREHFIQMFQATAFAKKDRLIGGANQSESYGAVLNGVPAFPFDLAFPRILLYPERNWQREGDHVPAPPFAVNLQVATGSSDRR